jgi:hypothetical protein
MSTSQSAETSNNRAKAIFTWWLYPAIGIPYLILGWWGGFGASFKSGAASAFMCGAIIAALGENIFDHVKDGFSRFRAVLKSKSAETYSASFAFAVALGFFFWNMYFATADKAIHHSLVDWVQVVVFIVAATCLPQARFAFTEVKPLKLNEIWGWYRTQFGWGFTLGRSMARAVSSKAHEEPQRAYALPAQAPEASDRPDPQADS